MKKRALMIIGIAVAALVVLGLYLIYINVFVNKHQLKLQHASYATAELRNIAAESSILPSYMWGRLENILEDDGYIMSNYMLEGRLATQDAVPSNEFLLTDQSLLLLKKLTDGDRVKVSSLMKDIIRDFRNDDGSFRSVFKRDGSAPADYTTTDELIFLEAYIEYYSAFGNSEDLENIKTLIGIIFDENGMIKPEKQTNDTYVTSNNVSGEIIDDGDPSFDSVYGSSSAKSDSENVFEFMGVKISDINLELIRNLENNDLLPQGTYEKYEGIVLSSQASGTIPYFAYAYTVNDKGEVDYIYSRGRAATMSVSESLKTMINLAKVGKLPDSVYTQFKANLINDGVLLSSYYIATGLTGGSELEQSYSDALLLAALQKDKDLYTNITKIIGIRVATRQQSRALYLVFRIKNDRYVFYGEENLKTYLVVKGMFAV